MSWICSGVREATSAASAEGSGTGAGGDIDGAGGGGGGVDAAGWDGGTGSCDSIELRAAGCVGGCGGGAATGPTGGASLPLFSTQMPIM